MDIVRYIRAYEQSAAEGLTWARDSEYNAGTFDYLRHAQFSMATQTMAKLAMQRFFRESSYYNFVKKEQNTELNIVGVGAESTVVRENGVVSKYLTGKSRKPAEIIGEISRRNDLVRQYLGEYVPHTTVDIQPVQIYRGDKPREYVRLEQTNINFEEKHVDPHTLYVDRELDMLHSKSKEMERVNYMFRMYKLQSKLKIRDEIEAETPDVKEQLRELSNRAMELFESEGLLLDFVNTGNVVYGSRDGESKRIFLIDTLAVDIADTDIIGHGSPFWNTDRYVESLIHFAYRVDSEHLDKHLDSWPNPWDETTS